MAVSKRLRYEVLRRDNHTCRYCGASAPDVPLTVDHVVPTTLGGTDDPGNLVAACRDCNSGKSATPPGAPLVADVAADALRWGRAMEYAREVAQRRRHRDEAVCEAFRDYWLTYYGDLSDMPDAWKRTVVDLYHAGLRGDDLADAVEASAQYPRRDPWRYFCGVGWNMVTALQSTARALLETEEN
jgi:hypothetical protein